MNGYPLISVIVPVYNVEKTIHRCVDSILSQTYGNIEIILVDDGSPDGSGAICDDYAGRDSRVSVIHKDNGGLSSARNCGIDAAKGEYIAFVDSDDYVDTDYLSFLYRLIADNGADISACGVTEIYPSGKSAVQCDDTAVHIMDSREALGRMCYNDALFVTAWDKLYRASLFDGRRYPEGKLYEDTGFTYLVVDAADKIVSCCEPKYFYVISDNSITTGKFSMKKLDYVCMADEMADFIASEYPDLRAAAERKRMHACFSTLTQLANSGQRNREVENYLMSRIKKMKRTVLKDRRTPRRDRAAISALGLGYDFFAFVWRRYSKAKKG